MLWAGPQHNVEPLTPANPSSSAPIPAYLAPGLPMEELMSSTFTWYWLQKLGARTPPHVLLLWTPTQIHLPSKRAPTATQGPARLSLLQPWRSLAEADLWRCPRWGNPYRVSTSGLAQVAGGREAAVWHEVLSVGQGPRGCRLAQMPQKSHGAIPPAMCKQPDVPYITLGAHMMYVRMLCRRMQRSWGAVGCFSALLPLHIVLPVLSSVILMPRTREPCSEVIALFFSSSSWVGAMLWRQKQLGIPAYKG